MRFKNVIIEFETCECILKLQVVIPYFLRESMFGMFPLVFCIIRVMEEFHAADFAFVGFFLEVDFVIMPPCVTSAS